MLIRAIEVIVIVLMGSITVVVIAEVALRNFAGMSLIITDEFGRNVMIWTAMLAATLVMHEDGHVRIDLLEKRVSPLVAKILSVIAGLVVLFFLGVLIYSSFLLMPSLSSQFTITMGISVAWFYAALPISAILMFWLTLRNIFTAIKSISDYR
ncbi:MAG: TRAP transporter small permease [Rhodospirillales bacterium]|nr:TRAP transporter small permease [Rhodospirillales bacterium]